MTTTDFDAGIVGGGLAGLAAAILLQRSGHRVVLFEKERYPAHKVCGEYISRESWNFLERLGLPLSQLGLPLIDTLHLTAPNGRELRSTLPLGGFGISRYLLDASLLQLAEESGVVVHKQTKVDEVLRTADGHQILFGNRSVTATVCAAAFGKRSNLDVRWGRPFLGEQGTRLNNYVGVKYHVRIERPANEIALHNFKDGYCGLSQIEDGKHCLCYLTKAQNLKQSGGIPQLQAAVLGRNPHLQKIFAEAEVLPGFPVTISQVSFSPKSKVQDGVLLLGDAAGMIAPLCGNGMSIALHTAKIAAELLQLFLAKKISRPELETRYRGQWQSAFAQRLQTGRFIQSFFGSEGLSNFFVGTFKALPFLAKPVIRLTHGKPF